MAVTARKPKGDFEPIPLGTQQAVCVFVEDIGTHEGNYQGKTYMRHQIVVCWELSENMTKPPNEGKPFLVTKFYTLSLGDKANLRKDLENWRGKAFTAEELDGFDVQALIGANCLLNIVEYDKRDGSKGQTIGSISKLMKGMPVIKPTRTEPPEWIARMRSESEEMKSSAGNGADGEAAARAEAAASAGEENLPF